MVRAFRLAAFLPLALLASIVAGGGANALIGSFGVSNWYSWLVGGCASAWAFFFVAFRVAPSPTPPAKWTCVAVCSLVGLLAALGPLMSGRQPVSALSGAAMLLIAFSFARRPVEAVLREIGVWPRRALNSSTTV